MSRSHSYSSNHSRGGRQQQNPNLAVTEASFQSLQLSDTSYPSSYGTTSQYPSRGSYGQESLSTNYLAPGYDAASFASTSPSASYLSPQRGVSPFADLDQDPGSFLSAEASSYAKPDMSSYSYHRATAPGSFDGQGSYPSSRSPSMHGKLTVLLLRRTLSDAMGAAGYAYASGDASSRRSMSYPSGPHVLPSSVLDAFSVEDREVARQRRRRLSESRRLAKARVRRTRLPTICEPAASMGFHMGHSIDFLTAPSTSSSYDMGGSSGYARASTTSSAPYLSGVTGYGKLYSGLHRLQLTRMTRSANPYGSSYPSSYGVGDVNTSSLYPR
ncbi:MAG: hypothetical protein Q9220_000569 [cf. Caloplaca sp. 1 TL-2023]